MSERQVTFAFTQAPRQQAQNPGYPDPAYVQQAGHSFTRQAKAKKAPVTAVPTMLQREPNVVFTKAPHQQFQNPAYLQQPGHSFTPQAKVQNAPVIAVPTILQREPSFAFTKAPHQQFQNPGNPNRAYVQQPGHSITHQAPPKSATVVTTQDAIQQLQQLLTKMPHHKRSDMAGSVPHVEIPDLALRPATPVAPMPSPDQRTVPTQRSLNRRYANRYRR
jgi:hypothetical protein